MIQAYLARVADELYAGFLDDVKEGAGWARARARYKDEYLYLPGLSAMRPRSSNSRCGHFRMRLIMPS